MNNNKNGYLLHTTSNNNIYLCKILNKYDNTTEAINDLAKISTNKIKEKELLKVFKKKDAL